MAQTFDIRFGRAAGLAGWLGAPANSFGWKGGGRLSIDAHGISIALKRGVASLLARHRTQRISAGCITEVYREGDALRIEFAAADDARAVLPFWARDREAAAQIVRLLPTPHTFEIDHGPPETGEKTGVTWIAPATLAAVLAMALWIVGVKRPITPGESAAAAAPARVAAPVAASAASVEPTPSAAQTTGIPRASAGEAERFTTPDEARKLAMLAEDPEDWTQPPQRSSGSAGAATAERQARLARLEKTLPAAEPELPAGAEAFVPMDIPEISAPVVVPIKQTTLAYAAARSMLTAFEASANDLDARYRRERQAFDDGSIDARTFADRMDALEIRWRSLADGLGKPGDPALISLRATLLSVVIYQRVFLSGYAAGLRDGDPDRIDRAFKDRDRSHEALVHARQYVS